jgi:hypothetical protein
MEATLKSLDVGRKDSDPDYQKIGGGGRSIEIILLCII